MSDRIDEYHGPAAKPLTTAEVEGWRATLGEHWAAKIGPLGHEVVIDGDRILALAMERDELRAALQQAFQWVPDDEVKEMEAERALAFGKDSDDE